MRTLRFRDVLKLNVYWQVSNGLLCFMLAVMLPVVLFVVGSLVGLLITFIKTLMGG